MDWNKLAVKAHENARKHGLWDEEHSAEYHLMQTVIEVGEIVQAAQNGRFADKGGFLEAYITRADAVLDKEEYLNFLFEAAIKDTVHDKLACVCLRLLDIVAADGRAELFSAYLAKAVNEDRYRDFGNFTFEENALPLVRMIAYSDSLLTITAASAVWYICRWASSLRIDLPWFIRERVLYDERRPTEAQIQEERKIEH